MPGRDAKQHIARLERSKGISQIPLSLKIFWEIVGEVNFMGYHPAWPEFSDPLVVDPVESVKYEYDSWIEEIEDGNKVGGKFGIPLAPDYFHKSNVSGGDFYKIMVPNGAIDAILENERHHTTFVNYLRITFRQGGFSGIQQDPESLPVEFSTLMDGLLPI